MGAALIKSCGNREPVTYVPIRQRRCYIRSLAEFIRFGVKHPIQGFLYNIFHHRVQVPFTSPSLMAMIFPPADGFLPANETTY